MAGELRLGTGTAPTGTSGYVTPFADVADKKVKTIDVNGVITTLSNDGLHEQNAITNGCFFVQQRVATASTAITGITTTTRGGVVADAWAVTTSVASNLNWARIDTAGAQDTGMQSRFYGSIISATAGKKVMLSQWILGSDMAQLRGKKVRLSLKHNQKVGAGQTYKLGLLQLQVAGTVDVSPAFLTGAWSTITGTDPAWGTNLAAIIPDASPTGEGGTITGSYLNCTTVATTWTKSSCVFTVPTNAKNLVPVFFSDATGGTTDNISIAEVQLTEGPELVDFVPTLLSVDMVRCQTRFCKTFAQNTVPVTSAGINTGPAHGIAGRVGAVANAGNIYWRFPVRMWNTPTTITLFNPAAANALMRNATGAADMGSTAATAQLDSSVVVIATGVAATAVGDLIAIHITADAEIVA